MRGNILVIPDTHAPYHNKYSVEFLSDIASQWKCKKVVHVGDVFDIHRVSKHMPEPNSMGIADEIRLAKLFVKQLAYKFPNISCVYGNHDLRAVKQAKDKGIPKEMLRPINEVFDCPKGWVWDYRHIIDEVLFIHGDGYSGDRGAITAAMTNRMSTVIGHIHAFGGILYQNNGASQIFGLNVGCMIDPNSTAFAYGSTMKNKPTLGCGVVIEGSYGHFIPML